VAPLIPKLRRLSSGSDCFRTGTLGWEWTLRLHSTEGRSLETPGEAFDVARKVPLEAEMVASEKAT